MKIETKWSAKKTKRDKASTKKLLRKKLYISKDITMRIQLNLCLYVLPHFHINITKAVFGKNYYDERKGLDKLEVAILH